MSGPQPHQGTHTRSVRVSKRTGLPGKGGRTQPTKTRAFLAVEEEAHWVPRPDVRFRVRRFFHGWPRTPKVNRDGWVKCGRKGESADRTLKSESWFASFSSTCLSPQSSASGSSYRHDGGVRAPVATHTPSSVGGSHPGASGARKVPLPVRASRVCYPLSDAVASGLRGVCLESGYPGEAPRPQHPGSSGPVLRAGAPMRRRPSRRRGESHDDWVSVRRWASWPLLGR